MTDKDKNIFIKFGLWLIFLLLIIIIGISKTYALSISNLTMYYTDYNGNNYTDSTTSTAQWGAYYTTFINHNFGGGLMFDSPGTLYAFFNSGQGCSNKNCILTGQLVAKTDSTFSNNTLSSVRIQIEQAGVYKNCSVIGTSMEYNTYSYLTFQCASYNLNSGFNIVFSQFSAPSTTFIKYGIPLNDYTLQETATTDDVIVNDNKNTQNIINNNNTNTQNIIDNQNQNTQQQIESQKVCNTRTYHYSDLPSSNTGFYTSFTELTSSSNWRYSDLIPVSSGEIIVYSTQQVSSAKNCFFDKNKTGISCYLSNTSTTTISENDKYVRFNINSSSNSYVTIYSCKNGNQALDDSINNLDNTLNDDDVGSATSDAGDFVLDFDTNTFGLTSIVTAPLNLIQSITSNNCSPLHLPLPFLNNKYLDLPCMTTIYENNFGALFTLYQTITFGIISYWIIVRIFNQVKDFKNPEHDEIEVVDL